MACSSFLFPPALAQLSLYSSGRTVRRNEPEVSDGTHSHQISSLTRLALSLASPAYARQQVLKGTAPEQTRWELIIYYFHRTDLIGLILLASAFGLLLVPATISTRLEGGYSNRKSTLTSRLEADFTATVIAMYVVGGVLLFVFAGWEWRIAKHPIMPSRVFNRSLVNCAPVSPDANLS